LFGRQDGCSGGKGGSMHIFDAKTNFLGGHGIVGGHVPIAAGVGFAIKYRRRPENQLAQDYEPPAILEVGWIVVPTIIFIGIFLWGAWLFFQEQRVPANALDIYVTGRQWMWKFQHPGGQREINTLHVPVGRAVRLTMASEDVIHSLFFPVFRVKMDVLPNRYRTMWFQATKTTSSAPSIAARTTRP